MALFPEESFLLNCFDITGFSFTDTYFILLKIIFVTLATWENSSRDCECRVPSKSKWGENRKESLNAVPSMTVRVSDTGALVQTGQNRMTCHIELLLSQY